MDYKTKDSELKYEMKPLEKRVLEDSSINYLLPEWLVELRRYFKYSKK